MPSPVPSPAPRLRQLRGELARRLDASLAGIRLAVIPGLPIDAFAFGDLVAISSRLLASGPERLLHAVSHELVHVAQQRAGRVPTTTHRDNIPLCHDPVLEAEAELIAHAIVRGERISLPLSPARRVAHPVLQPLISIGGEARAAESDFSAPFSRLLALIPQGPAWLRWAVRTPGPAFLFDDEATLLTGIQLGLHGTAVVPFASAGLRLAPALLLDLGAADFGNIVGSLETGQLTPAAQAALTRISVRTEPDFAQLAVTLARLGASAALPLASASIADLVSLHEQFVLAPPPADTTRATQAAAFAASVAQNPTEFAAAFAFHLLVADRSDTANPSATIWTQLAPLVLPYLKCPVVDPGATDEHVCATLAAWLEQSATIGFPTLATGIANCAAFAGLDLTRTLDDSAADRIRAYLLSLPRIANPPSTGAATPTPRITRLQDGVTRWFDFNNPSGRARFQLDLSGLLTLREFAPAP